MAYQSKWTEVRKNKFYPQTCPPVTLNNKPIPQADSAKYLGIHLDKRMLWKTPYLEQEETIKTYTTQIILANRAKLKTLTKL